MDKYIPTPTIGEIIVEEFLKPFVDLFLNLMKVTNDKDILTITFNSFLILSFRDIILSAILICIKFLFF